MRRGNNQQHREGYIYQCLKTSETKVLLTNIRQTLRPKIEQDICRRMPIYLGNLATIWYEYPPGW